jgi:hypothetical protein
MLAVAGRLARDESRVKSRDAINRVCTRVNCNFSSPAPPAPCPLTPLNVAVEFGADVAQQQISQ